MAAMMPVPETNSHCTDSPNYRDKYKTLKRKLKFLLYEQEYFQEELRRVQKKLLRVSRDKSFLLDRLLQYESVDHSSSDDDGTASSSGVSDSEGPKVLIGETPLPPSNSSRPKKTQVVNHGIAAESLGMFPYPSSDGTSSAGGEPSAAVNNKKSIQCKYVNNGNQCQERISKRSKSGYCNAHRTVIRISKQVASSPKQPHANSKPVPDPQRDNSSMVDQQQLERLQQLSESSSTSHMPQATEELPQEMFNVEDDDRDSENEDSPGSSSLHGNIYEGDDDLVIDLQE
ncbi:uncharacterized protein LOC144646531 isoform X3 [Oculina patagonica]